MDQRAQDQGRPEGHGGRQGGQPPLALALTGVVRRYPQGAGTIEVLRGADFAISHGQSVALVAPSGSGKSTLLHICLLYTSDAADE